MGWTAKNVFRTAATAAVGTAVAMATVAPSAASAGNPVVPSRRPVDLAVIGDAPYGEAAFDAFPELVDRINAAPHVREVVHVGDIKDGGSPCTDDYYAAVKDLFSRFADPLVYTPGDNEWTDCHRPADGGHVPTERLAQLRKVFFSEPGTTLGTRKKTVLAQPGYPEDVRWYESRVAFATFDIQGSNNDLEPWTGAQDVPPGEGPRAEWSARSPKTVEWLRQTFDLAQRRDAAGVVLFLQADMWSEDALAVSPGESGFTPFVRALARQARAFGRPVLVVNGDSHRFAVRHPIGSHYSSLTAPNLTQITIQRSEEPTEVGKPVPAEWLDLHVDPKDPGVFGWARRQATLSGSS